MKRIVFVFSALLVFSYVQAQIAESVIVEYESVHYGVEAKQILYIDNFGEKIVIDTYNTNNTTGRNLSLNGMHYVFFLENKKLHKKFKATEYDMIFHLYDMDKLEEKEYYVNVDKTGKETIAGKECDVYKILTADKKEVYFYIWKGILLKKVSKVSNLTAVQVIENPKFKDGQFDIPEGYGF